MDFTVSSAELLKGLLDVSKAIPAKSVLPILENFLFNVNEQSLTLTASDQDLTLMTTVPVSCDEPGAIAVPAHQILDLMKTIPDQPVRINTSSDSTFECKWSSGNSSLPYFPAEDYPEIHGVQDGAQKISFKAEDIAAGISGTIYATSDDEMRPAMNGILFDINPGATTLVASDSHKLICYSTKDVQTSITASFILHRKPAAALRAILDKDVETVDCMFDENTAVFTFGATTMTSRLIIGKYPKYRDVIPQNNSNILKIDRELLLSTVRRVAVCANKASNRIKFDLAQGQVEITAEDLGFSTSAYEKIVCDYSGENISIGFKSSFLIDILSNMTCQTLMIKFADARRAALIVPSEEEESSEKICGILMPIMV